MQGFHLIFQQGKSNLNPILHEIFEVPIVQFQSQKGNFVEKLPCSNPGVIKHQT